MLDDGTEFPCRTEDVSLSGIAVRGAPAGAIGEWVVAYVKELGRIEGVVVRRTPVWFALDLRAPPLKKLRLASVIDRLVRRGSETRADRPSVAGGCAPGGGG